MSKYTTEVRFICETEAGLDESVGYDRVEDVLTNSRTHIFGDYPIFDEAYRPVLEKKILRHYYTREIAFETVGLWKLKLNAKMNEIMPYYNKLYESELLEFDPFEDTNLRTEKSGEKAKSENEEKTKSENESNSTDNTGDIYRTNQSKGKMNDTTTDGSEKWDLFSNTPQGQLTDVKNGKYLTTADQQTSNASGTENQTTEKNGTDTEIRNEVGKETKDKSGTELRNKTGSDFEEFLETIKGKRGTKSYPELLDEFRKTFLNIDMLIIEELKDLFFLLW